MKKIKKIQIGIIGGSTANLPKASAKRILETAELLGRLIAKENAILFTGGMDGVMEFASKGAYEAGGIVVGTPGRNRNTANQYVTVEVCTPIDVGDFLFAGTLSCDAIIVLPGDAGTVAELMLAYRNSIPIMVLEEFKSAIVGLDIIKNYPPLFAKTPAECIRLCIQCIKNKPV